jgi:hypothetical protein
MILKRKTGSDGAVNVLFGSIWDGMDEGGRRQDGQDGQDGPELSRPDKPEGN